MPMNLLLAQTIRGEAEEINGMSNTAGDEEEVNNYRLKQPITLQLLSVYFSRGEGVLCIHQQQYAFPISSLSYITASPSALN